ncbi:STAS domain-containing protein [Actinomadura roseirufa]|uniref:STAS domain-containing protein n=1 Tax=Actinomadura roseirufa TaxID=2094049 RepID=UPI001040F46B|nr:STAS domain-containing protein [Actinomadura roseirufa]
MDTMQQDGARSDRTWTDPEGRLRTRSEEHGLFQVVYAEGEIDCVTATAFGEHVAALLGPPYRLVLDLQQVTFCDSSGLSALIFLWKAARANRGRLVVSRPSALCRRILRRTGLDERMNVSPTLRQAFARAAGIPAERAISAWTDDGRRLGRAGSGAAERVS